MDILLDEDETMIRETAAAFLAEHSPATVVRAAEASPEKYSHALWKHVAELGWCGICLDEEYGGQAAPVTWLGLLLEEVGRHIAPIPLATSSAAALTIMKYGDAGQRKILSDVASGEHILAYAIQEADGAWNTASFATRAELDGDDVVINGTKFFVDGIGAANDLLVAFRNSEDGSLGLGIVDRRAPGLTIGRLVNTAKGDQAQISLDNVRIPASRLVGGWSHGGEAIAYLMTLASAFATAQMAGAARRVTEMSAEYSRIRFAFGQPIGSFQSLQHLGADMLIAVDGSELLVREALWRMASGLSAELEVSQAKAFASIHCVSTCRSAQQIHGGMGFMSEFDLNLWYRRVVTWSLSAGAVYEHRQIVSSHLLDQSEPMRLDDCHPAERSSTRTLAA